MIYDKLSNMLNYGNKFKHIYDFLMEDKFISQKTILDESIQVIPLVYETKGHEELQWEAHRNFIDLHYIIEGEEVVQVSDIQLMIATTEYQDDFQFFEGNAEQSINCKKGDFLFLLPHEVHKTAVALNIKGHVKKYVFKIPLDY
jgi:biofilm protein TabA